MMMNLVSIGLIIQQIFRISSGQAERVYDIIGGSNDWYEANVNCLDQAFDDFDFTLATIYTAAEYEALKDLKDTIKPRSKRIDDDEQFWVGLYQNAMGEFVWADNTPCERDDGLCVNDWATEPDLATNTEYCVSLTVDGTDGSKIYEAVSCDQDLRYICSFINETIAIEIHEESDPIGNCGDDTYSLLGQQCVVSGDPHFTTWRGTRHDYQGNPHILYDDFYYVAPCFDASADDLPFTIIGHHYFLGWGNSEVTSLDYLTFELFLDSYSSTQKYDKYYLWLSSEIQAYIAASDADHTFHRDNPSYDYHKADSDLVTLAADAYQAIGDDGRFEVKYTLSGSNLEAWIKIDGTEELHFTMRGYYYYEGRNRGHSLYLDVPTNYRCFICGLCGDFKRVRVGDAHDQHQMITCKGGVVDYQWGWVRTHPDWEFPYDLNGNTWGYEYVSEQCPIYERSRRRRRLVAEEDAVYHSDSGDLVYQDPYAPCSQTKVDILDACQTARDGLTTECAEIGSDTCDDLQASCGVDVCRVAGNVASAIDAAVQQTFTAEVQYRANPSAAHAGVIPNNFEEFGDKDPQYDDYWNGSGVVVEISSKWVFYGGLLLAVVLTINCAYMCYLNTSKSQKGRRYSPVKFVDSEFDDSEAPMKN